MTRATYQLAIPALFAALLGSCGSTHGGNTFVVATKVIQPSGTIDATTKLVTNCIVSADSPEVLFPTFNGTDSLALGIALENRLQAIATTRPESNDFVAEVVVVNYESTDGNSIAVPEQRLPVQGFVAAGNKGAVYGTLIPAVLGSGALKGKTVRVHLYVVGRLNDGSTVKSSDYEFIAVSGPVTTACVGK